MVVVRRLRFPGRGRGRGRGRERERERGRDDCICEAVEQRHSCQGWLFPKHVAISGRRNLPRPDEISLRTSAQMVGTQEMQTDGKRAPTQYGFVANMRRAIPNNCSF